MEVAIKNEMEEFFPLGHSQMLKNNCTHSYHPILLIEKFRTTTNGTITVPGIWRKILTQMEGPRLVHGQMSQLAFFLSLYFHVIQTYYHNIQREVLLGV